MINIRRYKNKTYKLTEDKVEGFTEDIFQSLHNILQTERYQYPIYSGNYGVNLLRLIGKDVDYVKAELEREVTEALMYDDRVISVTNFIFEEHEDSLFVTFDVKTTGGDGQFTLTQTL